MKSMTIARKLLLCFVALLALLTVLSVVAFSALGAMQSRLEQTVNVDVRKLALTGQFNTGIGNLRSSWRGAVLFAFAKDRGRIDASKQALEKNLADTAATLEELRPLLHAEEEKALVASGRNEIDHIASCSREFLRLCGGNPASATTYTDREVVPSFSHLAELGPALDSGLLKTIEIHKQEASAKASVSRTTGIAVMVLFLLVGAVVLVVIRRIGASLGDLARQLSAGAEQAAAAALYISSSSQALAQGASEQAASVEEAASASEEITASIQQNTAAAGDTVRLMVRAEQIGVGGRAALGHLAEAIDAINSSSEETSKVLSVIDGIAFQTNILALNAAVEAARAGQAGAGFAVVADEVRNLAQRCAQAAKTTTELVGRSVSSAREGRERLAAVANSLQQSAGIRNDVKEAADRVSNASQEQARGVQQIATAMSQLSTTTQSTAAHAEQAASAGEELSAQSDTLRALVSRLNEMVGGSVAGDAGHTVPKSRQAAPRQSPAAAARTQDSPSGLAALQAAVSPSRHAGHSAGEQPDNSFPLEEEFQEF